MTEMQPKKEQATMPIDADPVGDIGIAKCCEIFQIHQRDLLGDYRYGFLMPGRFALCKALQLYGLSLRHIGRIMGRDHGTVRHAIKRAEYDMERDSNYKEKIECIRQSLQQSR